MFDECSCLRSSIAYNQRLTCESSLCVLFAGVLNVFSLFSSSPRGCSQPSMKIRSQLYPSMVCNVVCMVVHQTLPAASGFCFLPRVPLPSILSRRAPRRSTAHACFCCQSVRFCWTNSSLSLRQTLRVPPFEPTRVFVWNMVRYKTELFSPLPWSYDLFTQAGVNPIPESFSARTAEAGAFSLLEADPLVSTLSYGPITVRRVPSDFPRLAPFPHPIPFIKRNLTFPRSARSPQPIVPVVMICPAAHRESSPAPPFLVVANRRQVLRFDTSGYFDRCLVFYLLARGSLLRAVRARRFRTRRRHRSLRRFFSCRRTLSPRTDAPPSYKSVFSFFCAQCPFPRVVFSAIDVSDFLPVPISSHRPPLVCET